MACYICSKRDVMMQAWEHVDSYEGGRLVWSPSMYQLIANMYIYSSLSAHRPDTARHYAERSRRTDLRDPHEGGGLVWCPSILKRLGAC